MRDYGKVHSTFWTSPTTASLSDQAKILALYLLTSSHSTIAGVFRLPDGYVADDLGWSLETVAKGFTELLEKGFAHRCITSKWVWVVKHFEWNPPENPNQVKSAKKVAAGVPDECGWKPVFMRACGELLGLEWTPPGEPFGNPSATVPKPETGAVTGTEAGAVTGTGVDAAKAAPPKAEPPPPAPPAPPPAPPAPRASRLPQDWVLPKQWGEWALAEFPSWTADVVRNEAAKFGDFWKAKSGKDATKLDWLATWRNWCRNASPVFGAGARKHGPLTDEQRAAANAAETQKAMDLYRQRHGGGAAGGDVVDAETRVVEPKAIEGAAP